MDHENHCVGARSRTTQPILQPFVWYACLSGMLWLLLIPELLGLSELEIRRRLTLEEEKDELTSAAIDSSDNFTETKYLLYGLDLEEQQCVSSVIFVGLCNPPYIRRKLRAALISTTSDLPSTSVIELRTAYRRRFVKFRQVQVQYQPEVAPLLGQLPPTSMDPDNIHDAPIYLPSSLPPDVLRRCSTRLVLMETELRIGQCRDCLVQLRTKLNAQARLLKHKYVNVRHQASNTRSRNLLNRINAKIDVVATKYRHAFASLQALDQREEPEWRSEFLELGNQDVRGMSEAELPKAPTRERAQDLQARSLLNNNIVPEGNRTISWIWRGSLKEGLGDQSGQDEYGEGR